MAAIVVMTITLLTVFVAGAATVMLNDTVQATKVEKMDLALYLKPDTPEDIKTELKQALETDDNVAWVDIKSKEESIKRLEESQVVDAETEALITESGIELSDILPIEVSIHVNDIYNTDGLREAIDGQKSQFKVYEDPNSYEKQFWHGDNQKTVQNIANLANGAQIAGFALSGIFLFITILVIFNTIRLAIFARKDEIEMEKLIGAEKSYTRAPFLVEADLYGAISGIIAAGAGYTLILSFLPEVRVGAAVGGFSTELLNAIMIGYAPLVIIGIVVVGMIIGDISARLAVKKYLKY